MLLKIAWRNIWRNKTRSLVVIASVAVGLFAGMFMLAFFWGLMNQEIESAVETQLSHMQFHNRAFIDDKDVRANIVNAASIVENLKKDVQVKSVSKRIITTGMITSSSAVSGVEIHGIVPRDEKTVSSISNNIVEGTYFTDTKKNEIVIGKKLAEKLGVTLHRKIVLTFQSKSGDIISGSFRIAGIFRSRNSAFDMSTVFTHFDDLAQLLGTGTDVHEIAVILKDPKQVDACEARFKKQYPSQLIQQWKELSPEMAMVTELFDQLMYIIISIILLALMFGIINTMLMSELVICLFVN